jgi:hypothetical protein
MAVTKPRTRLVNFRLSEEEFNGLQAACLERGARSLSDFTRSAVLKEFHPASPVPAQFQGNLDELGQKVGAIEERMRLLIERLAPQQAVHVSGD